MSIKQVYTDRSLLRSEAFRDLTKTATDVYFEFLMKRKMAKVKTPAGRKKEWMITNNGDIIFTYSEAEQKGFSRSRFARALTQLVEHGFIDITHLGSGGRKNDYSTYAISERYKKWGTPDFEHKTRPKDTREGRGHTVVNLRNYKTQKYKLRSHAYDLKVGFQVARMRLEKQVSGCTHAT